MNTKGTIRINVEGASLTEAEKEEILNKIANQLNESDNVRNINDYREPEDTEGKFKGFKEGVGNLGKSITTKLGNLNPQTVFAWSSAILMLTTGTLKVSQEVRLIRKEHRLQKEAKRRAR